MAAMNAVKSLVSTACGELACQKDSYLKVFTSTVVSCTPRTVDSLNEKKNNKQNQKKKNVSANSTTSNKQFYDVLFNDSILFPEGGGQPSDTGSIIVKNIQNNDNNNNLNHHPINVIKIENRKGKAIHILDEKIEPGTEIEMKVNWKLRKDYMIQHSSQHLITALCLKNFHFETISWNLGDSICFLEINTPDFTLKQLYELEELSNQAIQENHSVIPTWHTIESIQNNQVKGLRTSSKSLPDSVMNKNNNNNDNDDDNNDMKNNGLIRVITIDNIDMNTCCGTHVKKTKDLICIKLLKLEKTKTSSKIFFVAGDRVLNTLGDCYNRELLLVNKLCVGSNDLVHRVDDIMLKQRTIEKVNKSLTLEVVKLTAQSLIHQNSTIHNQNNHIQNIHNIQKADSEVEECSQNNPINLITKDVKKDIKNDKNVLFLHRETSTSNEFCKMLAMELDAYLALFPPKILFITVTDEALGISNQTKSGTFFVAGPSELVKLIGPKIASILQGKGGGKGDRYQGKCQNLLNISEALTIAEEIVQNFKP